LYFKSQFLIFLRILLQQINLTHFTHNFLKNYKFYPLSFYLLISTKIEGKSFSKKLGTKFVKKLDAKFAKTKKQKVNSMLVK